MNHILLTGIVALAAARPPAQSPRPDRLHHKPFLVGPATGVRIYACNAVADGHKWGLVAPRADLYDGNGKLLATHGGPTWEARDGSTVVAPRQGREHRSHGYRLATARHDRDGFRPPRRPARGNHLHPADHHRRRPRSRSRGLQCRNRRHPHRGPLHRRLRLLQGDRQLIHLGSPAPPLRGADCRAELLALTERHNRSADGRIHMEAEYLITVARGAWRRGSVQRRANTPATPQADHRRTPNKPNTRRTNPMRAIIKRLSRRHTTAVAYLALFAALGGSAYAAVTVTGKNIKDGTITGKDVKNLSLDRNKLSAQAVSSLTGRPGPAGSQGVAGPKGEKGEQGPVGPSGATGPKGEQGPVGPSGPTGATGAAGRREHRVRPVPGARAGSAAGGTGPRGWRYRLASKGHGPSTASTARRRSAAACPPKRLRTVRGSSKTRPLELPLGGTLPFATSSHRRSPTTPG